MKPAFRSWGLVAHILSSVGWFGAAVAYLSLSIFVLFRENTAYVHGVYFAMNLIGWIVIVPFSLAALITGFIQSAISPWGLLRHYWVVAKTGADGNRNCDSDDAHALSNRIIEPFRGNADEP